MKSEEVLFLAGILLFALPLFAVPAVVALRRGHPHAAAVVALNACLLVPAGGSFAYRWPELVGVLAGFGWIAALVWSLVGRGESAPRKTPTTRADLPLSCPFCRSLVRPPDGGFDGNAVCGRCGGSFLPF